MLVETDGAEPVASYDQNITCCGSALAFSEPDKSQIHIKKSIESAYFRNAEMIVTPWPEWQYCRSKKLAAIAAK